jgi:hypothetical protein
MRVQAQVARKTSSNSSRSAELIPVTPYPCARRHRQKETATGCLALHFATDFVGYPFREDALAASLSSQRVHSSRGHAAQPTESIHNLTVQQWIQVEFKRGSSKFTRG